MSDKIGVTLSSNALEVNAGESVGFTATIHNRSQIVDQFTTEIVGLDPSWYDLSVTSVSLFPGDRDEVSIVIHPPKTAETNAGSYPFTVKAVSGADPQEFTVAEASVSVRTFAELSVEMSPTRVVGRSGTYGITLNNQGNADVTQSFEASDAEEALSYTFKPEEVTVRAGGSATVELLAQLKKKPKVEGEKEYPFQVVVKPSGADRFSPEAKMINGQLVYERKARPKPRMPWWLIAVIAAVAAVIIGILLFRSCAISPPSIIEFAYEPAEEGYMLSWLVEGASEGDVNGEAIAEEWLEKGGMPVYPTTLTKYVLTVSNRGGEDSALVTIQPPPVIQFFEAEWIKGGFLLTWGVVEATDVYLNGEPVSSEGEIEVAPDEPAEYVLTASNEGGEVEGSVAVAPAAVTVTSPDGGEEWVIGSRHDITWTTTNPEINGSPVEAGIHHVGLEYSSDGGKTGHSVATNEENDGAYRWRIPDDPSERCLVQITIYCSEGNVLDQDTSDAFFSIVAGGEVELLRPTEGEQIASHIWYCPPGTVYLPCHYIPNEYEVMWDSEGAGIDHVSLAYRVEGGSWQTIVSNYPDTGSYLWTVPDYEYAVLYIRVTIYDSAGDELDSDTNGPVYVFFS
jgi:hypothetical protein